MDTKYLPGLRILKTTLAVAICLIAAWLIGYPAPFYAAITAVLMMKSSPKHAVRASHDRILGTLFGGVIGIFFLIVTINFNISSDSLLYTVLIVLVLLIDLTLCKILNLREYATSMSAILVLAVLLNHNGTQGDAIQYMVRRILETLFGILISVIINKYINLKEENCSEVAAPVPNKKTS